MYQHYFFHLPKGYDNLSEGFKVEINKKASLDNPNIYHCGDVMYDKACIFQN